MARRYFGLAALLSVVVAVYFVWIWDLSSGYNLPAFDIYQYFYPNMLYATRVLASGGHGLLWNAYQNCGQPFLGIGSTGFLYPANAFFLVLDADVALRAVAVFNLSVAGLSCYFLCRELGASVPAAMCGAVAFELGTCTVDLITWSPLVSAPYVWIPAAMLFCERTLRAPTWGNAVGLAGVVAIAMLQGFPQITFFTYQLVALRVLYEILTRRLERPGRTLGMLGLAALLPPLLTAVHLLPSLEMARLSVRGSALSTEEIAAGGFLTWKAVRAAIKMRRELFNPLLLLPFVVAGASLLRTSTRRPALFYLLAGGLYFALSLGPETPLFEWYLQLPFGRLFREPARLMWLTNFCLAVAAACGVEAVLQTRNADPVWRRVGVVLIPFSSLLGFLAIRGGGFLTQEWVLGGLTVAAALTAAVLPRLARGVGLVIALAIAINLLGFPYLADGRFRYPIWTMRLQPLRGMIPSGKILDQHEDALTLLRENRMTPQDRIFIVPHHPGFELEPKVAGLHGVPAIQDYEPQPARRYADYFVMLRIGRPMDDLNDFYIGTGMAPYNWTKWPLLNLAAARYVIVDDRMRDRAGPLTTRLRPLSPSAGIQVYENPQAFARARYVPRIDVVPDAAVLLQRLAGGGDDLGVVEFVEEDLPSGFRGEPGNREPGDVEFLKNDPEHLVLRVRAPARGFLFLADQYFPGWSATVNGVAAPIWRANYLFRTVEVPAGESTVEFRYRPLSVGIGAAVSVLTALGVVVGLARSRRKS